MDSMDGMDIIVRINVLENSCLDSSWTQKGKTMTLLEMAYQAGIQPKWAASTGGGEYHSSCPDCGGRDRFYMQPNRQMNKCLGFYCCRQCGASGDSIQFARQFLKYTFHDAAQAVNASLSESYKLPSFQKSYSTQTVV